MSRLRDVDFQLAVKPIPKSEACDHVLQDDFIEKLKEFLKKQSGFIPDYRLIYYDADEPSSQGVVGCIAALPYKSGFFKPTIGEAIPLVEIKFTDKTVHIIGLWVVPRHNKTEADLAQSDKYVFREVSLALRSALHKKGIVPVGSDENSTSSQNDANAFTLSDINEGPPELH